MQDSKAPTCPSCGSDDIGFPGICTYRYRRGKWRAMKGSVQMNDSADSFHCGACGTVLYGSFKPPFNFTVQPGPFDFLDTRAKGTNDAG